MDKATQLLGVFGKIIPQLSDAELDRLIAFGQGMAFKASQNEGAPPLSQRMFSSGVRPSA